ncbi:hypothetical protein [uncultured Hyphomicrobium sp.]|uniref:hypothetical protein n=1 Tax=uncultured Hyphomicrobium sp. TaxID=194373 RepID=UPI0025D6F452|nr:hypothetical protein [uncultured Hyphomicrobium sp.]
MDRYFHWAECLRTRQPATTDEPCCGFWRRKVRRGGRFQAIAVFERDGDLVCVVDDREASLTWTWSPFLEAISEETYRLARAEGRFRDDLVARDGSLTTELRDCVAVLPIVKEQTNGTGRDDPASGGQS